MDRQTSKTTDNSRLIDLIGIARSNKVILRT